MQFQVCAGVHQKRGKEEIRKSRLESLRIIVNWNGRKWEFSERGGHVWHGTGLARLGYGTACEGRMELKTVNWSENKEKRITSDLHT